jgi:hypothetical protein
MVMLLEQTAASEIESEPVGRVSESVTRHLDYASTKARGGLRLRLIYPTGRNARHHLT